MSYCNLKIHEWLSALPQILGTILGLAGMSGFFGASSRSANLLNVSVVMSIIGLLISFQFIGEVNFHPMFSAHIKAVCNQCVTPT